MTQLAIRSVTVRYGGVTALRDCSFDVDQGTCTAVIGPNGAGKTTLMNAISGLVNVSDGSILWEDQVDLTTSAPPRRAYLGIARTFQITKAVEGVTVLDYVVSGALPKSGPSTFHAMLRTGRFLAAESEKQHRAVERLEQLGVDRFARSELQEVPLGARRLVDMARALMCDPRLIMLDEVVAGVEAADAEMVGARLRSLVSAGTTVLLIEHNMNFVREVASGVVVLVDGSVLAEGDAEVVLQREDVLDAFVRSSSNAEVG